MNPNSATRAQRITLCSAFVLLFSLIACGAPSTNITLDLVYFNYLDRPIFDAFIDGKGGESSTPYPATGGGTILGVPLEAGAKKVSWRLSGPEGAPRNGEKVVAKNTPELKKVPDDARFLAIHIYPDETVELVVTPHYPRATAKGIAFAGKRPVQVE